MSEALAYQEEYEAREVINGREYMMSRPSVNHLRIEGNIFGAFSQYLRGKRCEAFFEPNVRLSDKEQFIPDVVIVCNPDIIEDYGIHGTPDLVVEVLSPSTARIDRTYKKATYEKYGVKEYWLVDPLNRTVEIYHLIDGKFELGGFCVDYREKDWARLTERQQAETQKTIQVSLYDDFMIEVAEVFRGVD